MKVLMTAVAISLIAGAAFAAAPETSPRPVARDDNACRPIPRSNALQGNCDGIYGYASDEQSGDDRDSYGNIGRAGGGSAPSDGGDDGNGDKPDHGGDHGGGDKPDGGNHCGGNCGNGVGNGGGNGTGNEGGGKGPTY